MAYTRNIISDKHYYEALLGLGTLLYLGTAALNRNIPIYIFYPLICSESWLITHAWSRLNSDEDKQDKVNLGSCSFFHKPAEGNQNKQIGEAVSKVALVVP